MSKTRNKTSVKPSVAKAFNNIKSNNIDAKQILPCGLYLVATPIGNLGDITKRAIEIFTDADIILCEDTRVTRKLCSFFGIENKFYRADEEATLNAIELALATLNKGGAVAFAPDAGTPSISDPGQRLAAAIIAAGFEVYALPGASSVLNAISVSGFDARQFAFLGFIPTKSSARHEFLKSAANLGLTIAMFETAPRLLASLAAIGEYFPDCNIMVSRELTKLYEEKRRGKIGDLLAHYNEHGAPKGEIVIVIEKPEPKIQTFSDQGLEALLIDALKTHSVKDSAAIIAKQTGINKRTLYEMAIKLK